MPLAPGTRLGPYEILAALGAGGMGEVYRARDPRLGREVALKVLPPEVAGSEDRLRRFEQEARAAGSLNHANIVTVYDVGKAGDIAFIAMEFIEGEELRTLIGEGRPLPVEKAVSIAAQVADGLAYAHQHGVVHRDIKPANIMVAPSGPVKITDFGIARMRSSGDLTQTGMMLGSPKYMSPEQVIGKRADHRSDIFSLGVILYEMLTGTAPFNGDNVTALMYQIVNFVPPAPSAVNPTVPELLDYIVAKMLTKALDERYHGAQDVTRDLRECERQMSAPLTTTAPPRPGAALASGLEPELVDTNAKTVVMAQTLNRTRQADSAPEEMSPSPARGLAHSFDSLEATQRLATLTGASSTLGERDERQSTTQALGSMPRPQRAGWRRRDWLLVGGAALLGAVVARLVAKRRDP
jgi:serine/threonine-protein kinase